MPIYIIKSESNSKSRGKPSLRCLILLVCRNSPEKLTPYSASKNTVVAGVRLYFGDNYPAYYAAGVLEITETGNYFFVSPSHTEGKPNYNTLIIQSEELNNYLRTKKIVV